MEHTGGVRRGVASTCDRSFDLISIVEKVDFGSNSYIGMKMIISKHRFLKIGLSQTTPLKKNATTIGWYQFFCEHIVLIRFLPLTYRSPGKPWFPLFLIVDPFRKASTLCGGPCIFGRILGEPSRRLHLLIGAILKEKWAIEHIAEDERGQKQTGTSTSLLKLE